MATLPAAAPIATRFRSPSRLSISQRRWGSFRDSELDIWKSYSIIFPQKCERRRTLTYAVDQDAEKSFKTTVEVDRLIDMLRDSSSTELEKLVVENILAFNENFWIRLAARTDTCKSDDDKKDYEELAASLMSIVDLLVHKTNEKIESATDVLKTILNTVMDEIEEISWPPKDPKSLILMEKELVKREQEGQLDEGFLSEVNAQLRQVLIHQRGKRIWSGTLAGCIERCSRVGITGDVNGTILNSKVGVTRLKQHLDGGYQQCEKFSDETDILTAG